MIKFIDIKHRYFLNSTANIILLKQKLLYDFTKSFLYIIKFIIKFSLKRLH